MKRLLLCAGASLVLGTGAFAQVVVYDNTTNDLHNDMPLLPEWRDSSAEAGDEIWLAGTAREVVQMTMLFYYRGTPPGTFDAHIRFRDIDNFNNTPGDVFWDSGIIPNVPTIHGLNTYTFDIPHVLVPGHFVWTIEATNRQGSVGELGPAYFNPATVGFSDDFFWLSDGGSEWIAYNWGGDPYANFAAQVVAVPEPATIGVLGLGLIAALRRRRK